MKRLGLLILAVDAIKPSGDIKPAGSTLRAKHKMAISWGQLTFFILGNFATNLKARLAPHVIHQAKDASGYKPVCNLIIPLASWCFAELISSQ